MIAVVVGALYAATKFVPVYMQGAEVESILDSYRHNAASLDVNDPGDSEDKILDAATADIIALGIEERYLEVYFTDGFETLNADYRVVVRFPFGKSVNLDMAQAIPVPQ